MSRILSRACAVAALAFLALAGPASGAYSYGSIVDKNDYDFQQAPSVRGTVPAAGKFVLPCFADTDGDGVANGAETLYLAVRTGVTQACDRVRAKDIRLIGVGAFQPGSDVKAADSDFGMILTQLGTPAVPMHNVRVFNNGDIATTVRKADTVYLDVMNVAGTTVDVGDVRLSPFGTLKAGTRVAPGDPDLNFGLMEFNSGAIKSLYTANMIFEFGKGWYLNADLDAAAGGAVEEGDVRLTSTVPNPFADIVAGVGNPGKIVESLRFSADPVRAGEPFQAYILVKNPTAKIGSALVETRLDGVLLDARGTPSLALNEAATLVVTLIAPTEPGQHKVQAGETTAFFEVEAAPTPEPATPAATTAPAEPEPTVTPASVGQQSVPAVNALMPLMLLGLVLALMRRSGSA